MKIVDLSDATDLATLVLTVEAGEDVTIMREGKPVARLSKAAARQRRPGILADNPAWKDFQFDPALFAPLSTDDELKAEGWPV